jgi:hypothetical protein
MIGRAVAAAYVATVAGLTAAAFSDHDVLRWAEVAAAVLALPTVVVALPAIYVLGAWAWSFADSPSSGSASSADPVVAGAPIWPVTLTFTVVMTLVACANVALVRRFWLSCLRRGPATGRERPPSRQGTPP